MRDRVKTKIGQQPVDGLELLLFRPARWPQLVLNPGLTLPGAICGMVTRKRLRAFLTALGYYFCAALFIGYFAVNAYTGERGLRAKQDIETQIAELSAEFDELKRTRTLWEKRVGLLRPGSLDPDLLDERARSLLGYAHPHDLVTITAPR